MKKNLIFKECLDYLQTEEIKYEIKSFIKPFLYDIFKELTIYFYFLLFIIISIFIFNLGIIILLVKYNKKLNNLL